MVKICLFATLILSASSAFGWWQPRPGTTWQWQIDGDPIDMSPNVTMFDVDLDALTQAEVNELHRRGRIVICYFSAGSSEDYRDDFQNFSPQVLGKGYDGYPNERWLDIRSDNVRQVMLARINLAKSKGCDGVEPDNVDNHNQDTGFPISYDDQLNYSKWMFAEAHKRNMSIGLKNTGDMVQDLLPYFDWSLVESCRQYDECGPFDAVVAAGKAVFGVEYRLNQRPSVFCPEMNRRGFSWLQKNEQLNYKRRDCRDQSTWRNRL